MDRYDPFESMERMFEQMRRSMMMDDDFGRMALPSGEGELTVHDGPTGRRTTDVRMERTDEGFVAIADVPGFERDELTVRIDDDQLVIEGHHEVTDEDETGVRSFSRRVSERVRIPGAVDLDAVSGSYRNGVLEIALPTLESPEDDAHVIDIE